MYKKLKNMVSNFLITQKIEENTSIDINNSINTQTNYIQDTRSQNLPLKKPNSR